MKIRRLFLECLSACVLSLFLVHDSFLHNSALFGLGVSTSLETFFGLAGGLPEIDIFLPREKFTPGTRKSAPAAYSLSLLARGIPSKRSVVFFLHRGHRPVVYENYAARNFKAGEVLTAVMHDLFFGYRLAGFQLEETVTISTSRSSAIPTATGCFTAPVFQENRFNIRSRLDFSSE